MKLKFLSFLFFLCLAPSKGQTQNDGPKHFQRPSIQCSFTFARQTPDTKSRYPEWIQRIAHQTYESLPQIQRSDLQNLSNYTPVSNGIINNGLETATYMGFPVLIKYFSVSNPNDFITWLSLDERAKYIKRKVLIEFQWLKILQKLRVGPYAAGIITDQAKDRIGIVMRFIPGTFMKESTMGFRRASAKAYENLKTIRGILAVEGIVPKDFQFIVMKYDNILVIDPSFFEFEDPMDPGVRPMSLHYF